MSIIYTRRSIRKFQDIPLTRAELEKLVRAGMAAACAKNTQNRLFFVQEGLGTLPNLINDHPFAFPLKTATASIVVASDLKKAVASDPANDWWVQDCSASLQNILLQADEMGLGSLWIGIHPHPKRVLAAQKDLELPEHIIPLGAVALGHPAESKAPNDRYDLDKVFFGKYEERG